MSWTSRSKRRCPTCARRSSTLVPPCWSRRRAAASRPWSRCASSTSRGWPAAAGIVVLQPRRVATRAVAARLAAQLGEEVGGTVGYRIRDDARRRTRLPHRGRDRGHPHPPTPVGPVVARARLPSSSTRSTSATCRPTSASRSALEVRRTHPARPPPARHVGDPRRRARRDAPRRTRRHRRGHARTRRRRWSPPPPRSKVVDAVPAAVHRALADADRGGDVLVFLPGVGEINRVRDALARRRRRRAGAARLAAGRPSRTGRSSPAAPAARDPRHRHRRDVAHRRGRARRRRRRARPGAGPRRPHRHDPPAHGAGVAGLGRPARRPCRPPRSRASRGGCGRRSSTPPAARSPSRRSPASTWPASPSSSTSGAATPSALAAGSTHRRAVPSTTPAPCSTSSASSAPTLGRRAAALPVHPRLARMVLDAPADDRWAACVLATVLDGRPPPGDAADITLRVGRLRRTPGPRPPPPSVLEDHARGKRGPRASRTPGGCSPSPTRTGSGRPGAGRGGSGCAAARRRGCRRPTRWRRRRTSSPPTSTASATAPASASAPPSTSTTCCRRRRRRARAPQPRLGPRPRRPRREGRPHPRPPRPRHDVREPSPGEATTAALVDHVRRSKLAAAPDGGASTACGRASRSSARVDGDAGPTSPTPPSLKRLDEWLAPFLAGATSKHDVEVARHRRRPLDVAAAGARAELAERAPESLRLPSGRSVTVDYGARVGPDHRRARCRTCSASPSTRPSTASPLVVAAAVARRPPGAGDERPARVLDGLVARGPQGDGRPLPQARLARGPLPLTQVS